MPFGARVIHSGGVHFRLWAPTVSTVGLWLDEKQEWPMEATGSGWFEQTLPLAKAGNRYRFRLPNGLLVPDPASRYNPLDVHGPSEIMDPTSFDWPDEDWHGRPWEEAVIYELHVGTLTSKGTFSGVLDRLDHLTELGVTALEIMPVADFPGTRNWGYDGVLPFAPDATYGTPDDLKRLVAAAHQRQLMVLLDVVYNHFGPEGNYLHAYAAPFFNPRHTTPWGAAINLDGEGSRTVRDFFIHNALYWLEEFHLDGLRLDAIHALCDESSPDFIEELAIAVRQGPGQHRPIHLIVENDRNQARYLGRDATRHPCFATAQWNDDFHHVLHVVTSGETDGYYADYTRDPVPILGRCLSQGFAWQGEPSSFRGNAPRGEPSGHLPPAAFVNHLQTHDQVGNRAFGERLCHLVPPARLEAATTLMLLAPHPPMLFMGEEFAAAEPFLFFCDLGSDLAQAVTEGRRHEFSRFARFADPAVQAHIPDPMHLSTFTACILDWQATERMPHRVILELHQHLLALRRRWIVPRLSGMGNGEPVIALFADHALTVRWRLGDGALLTVMANLSDHVTPAAPVIGMPLFATTNLEAHRIASGHMAPWSVTWHLQLGDPS
ncbi:MAG: malto-oligosyltrehalose trehalohydrolase [Magnetococcales bacterium]|nr:malto-oligosyltrehalose trehalohydrolase [Magnetococcales bacterium]